MTKWTLKIGKGNLTHYLFVPKTQGQAGVLGEPAASLGQALLSFSVQAGCLRRGQRQQSRKKPPSALLPRSSLNAAPPPSQRLRPVWLPQGPCPTLCQPMVPECSPALFEITTHTATLVLEGESDVVIRNHLETN